MVHLFKRLRSTLPDKSLIVFCIFLGLSVLSLVHAHGDNLRSGKHKHIARRGAANSTLVTALSTAPAALQTSTLNDAAMMGTEPFWRRQSAGSSSNSTKLPVGTCTKTIPCANGACCNGAFCGYGPQFCGGNCTSNCQAQAECGQYAPTGQKFCPLGVCCSRYGFCGTTDDFCNSGCQSGCGQPEPPKACGNDQQSATKRRIGYYEGWATDPASRPYNQFPPSIVNAKALTHINYAFALIGDDFRLKLMSPRDLDLYGKVVHLKDANPELKVFLSVGGWTFNDPPTQHIFSDLVGSQANTDTFIKSAMRMMQAFGFDGLDIDWEYPTAGDRGGRPEDRENFVRFMRSVNNVFKSDVFKYGLTWTAPSSYWYLRGFDLQGLAANSDWINLMTYDLHGVWDGDDPYIGQVVLAHTNLTEIRQSVNLFARSKIPMSKLNLGLALYSRSYTLSDPSCTTPGCPFAGAGRPLGSSIQAGTISYADMQTLLANGPEPQYDEGAGIKYVVFDEDQWASFDDEETFDLKLDYANSICMGGTMIWSIDQDTATGQGLEAIYKDLAVQAGHSAAGPASCLVTDCGEKCPSGFSSVSKVSYNPERAGLSCDIKKQPAQLCCPTGASPTKCHWNRGPASGPCYANACAVGEAAIFQDPIGDGSSLPCSSGAQTLCCTPYKPQPKQCVWGSCENPGAGIGKSCPASFSSAVTTGLQGDTGSQACFDNPSTLGFRKPLCCSSTAFTYENCAWHGTAPNCLDATCPVGKVAIATDISGDLTSMPDHCSNSIGNRPLVRSYCCDPPVGTESGIPIEWLFPSPSDTLEQTLQIDPEISGPVASSDELLDGSDKEDPDENEFGSVFISSPRTNSVSSMARRSDWVITDCHPTSDQPQQALAYCRKSMNASDSGCNHVMIGGAEHTIVRLPTTCARGNWARIESLEVHPDQNTLPAAHARRLPQGEKVYALSFDYEFARIPSGNGPIEMRIDASDIVGYYDQVINSPQTKRSIPGERRGSKCSSSAGKRDFHQCDTCGGSRHQKRWWGAFKDWLARVANAVRRGGITNSKHFSFAQAFTIFHQEEQCTINGVDYSSSLDLSVILNANADAQYGVYVQGTVVPPHITSAYLDFTVASRGTASLKLTASAEAQYSSGQIELIRVGFPGLSYPGLVTIGPSLAVYGQLDGHVSVDGEFTLTQGVDFPPTGFKMGWSDGSSDDSSGPGSKVDYHGEPASYQGVVHGGHIDISGSLVATIQPSMELGITILGGALLDARAFSRVDLAASMALRYNPSPLAICFTPGFTAQLVFGITGNVLLWEPQPTAWTLSQASITYADSCLSPPSSKRDGESYSAYFSSEHVNATQSSVHPLPVRAQSVPSDFGRSASQHSAVQADVIRDSTGLTSYVGQLRYPSYETRRMPSSDLNGTSLAKRASYLPGNLFCPTTAQTDGSGCTPMSVDPGDPDWYDGNMRKRNGDFFLNQTEPSHGLAVPSSANAAEDREAIATEDLPELEKRVVIPGCNYNLLPAPYDNAPDLGWWDFAKSSATTLSPTTAMNFPPLLDQLSAGGTTFYAREHIYEMNLLTRFIAEHIRREMTDLWEINGNTTNWCGDFVRPFLIQPFGGRAEGMTTTLRNCQPRNAGTLGMPRLEQTINRAKSNYLNGKDAFRVSTFNSKTCPSVKVLALRQAAGVMTYMNDGVTRSEFLGIHRCVSNAWRDWQTAYAAQPGAPANAGRDSVPDGLKTWITEVLATFNAQIRSNVDDLIDAWETSFQAQAQTVDLGYSAAFNTKANAIVHGGGTIPKVSTTVTTQDLRNTIAGAVSQGITWINQL